jgi:hypothetical protein
VLKWVPSRPGSEEYKFPVAGDRVQQSSTVEIIENAEKSVLGGFLIGINRLRLVIPRPAGFSHLVRGVSGDSRLTD